MFGKKKVGEINKTAAAAAAAAEAANTPEQLSHQKKNTGNHNCFRNDVEERQ